MLTMQTPAFAETVKIFDFSDTSWLIVMKKYDIMTYGMGISRIDMEVTG